MHKRLHLLMTLLLCLVSSAVMAQVTTSGIGGKVVAGDESLIGVTITAVHEPSGTRYTTVTNADGRYTIQGMRVGGPYTVTFNYVGYKAEVKQNLQLSLGNAEMINVNMKEDTQTLGELTVTGKMGRSGSGPATNFSRADIENAPTVNRNIYDVAKLSPMVNVNRNGGITINGANNRYNSFQIDGMVANDVFGLTSSGTNGGQSGANPISLDAIDQIQVAVSPFDVRQSGFTGGSINAITKSGTNKFMGSAYAYYTNENMYGAYSQLYNKTQKLSDESTQTYGFSFGGPIVKDKLFFFTSLEYKKNSYPQTLYPGAEGYFLDAATAQAIIDRYAAVTGIHDSFARPNIDREGTSLLGRLDWNINDKNHFTLRYQGNLSYDDNLSVSRYTYTFNKSGYKMRNRTHSFVAELTSRISDKVYNEVRAGLTMVRDNRDIAYKAPLIYITGGQKINLGPEYSSGVNFLDQDIYTVEDNLSIYSGTHTFTLGLHNEYYNMKNAFIQAAYGEFVYNNVNSFLNDEVPASYVYNYSDPAVTGTTQWATPFRAGLFGIYAQDKWNPTTNFELTYGLRLDIPFYYNQPTYNDEFNNTVNWSLASGARIGRRPANMVNASPRVGFKWYLDDEHKSLLRGGTGIFNGRAPFVWIENAWANTGIEMKGGTIYTGGDVAAPKFGDYGDKPAIDALNSGKARAASPNLVTIDHKFRFPQAYRANLAWEQVLPWKTKLTLEALYSRALNAVWFENLALSRQGTVYAVPGVEASAAPYYSSNQSSPTSDGGTYRANSVINLTNVNKGHSYSFSAQLEKEFDFGLSLSASYTFGHSYSVNDGTSSVATSNWGYYYSVDPNDKALSYSIFDIPHKVMAQATYDSKRYAGGRMQTHVSLVYNGFSGSRYSLTMDDNTSASFNGDYRRGNSLLYIPTATELQTMAMSEDDRASFEAWITADAYAKNHRGRYAARNSNVTPWENHFDLHLTQDFFYLKERGSKVSLVFDILNVANLLNHDWGTTYSGGWNMNILSVQGVKYDKNTGVATPTYKFLGNKKEVSDVYSRWHMQLGVRVTF